jgi:drug/metabolite transporter (DMT)-like permease
MLRLILWGILAAFFFSSTFVLNRLMSAQGGHWVWTASLRYGYALLFICAGFLLGGRARTLGAVFRVFARHWRFWLLAGGLGFTLFYAGIAFAASYAPGWVIATTWQTTILATPVVLAAFGRRVPVRGVLFAVLIFAGILLVNVEYAVTASWRNVLLGGLPVLVSAFAYPAGVQLVWEARHRGNLGARSRLPAIADPVVDNPFARVLLLVLGSIPWWLLLIAVTQPPPPTPGQWLNSALVALSSGIVASALFLHARHLARTPYQLSAVDSTQSAEVLFTLAAEVLLLGAALPGWPGLLGAGLTVIGLVLYLLAQGRHAPPVSLAELAAQADEPDALDFAEPVQE